MNSEFNKADAELNVAYQQRMKLIQPYRRNDLRDVQQLWIRYRDGKCGLFYHKQSGFGGLLDAQQCMLDETLLRTAELKALY
ncbi:DUF1311 domain-containing protein [Vibrio coralliilyticus]|nr:DUF1311 domain-containing protein [Vibrio coralliilyticus]